MAIVYLAIQESFEREVALKVMSPQLSKDPSFGERFIREARIVSRLMHPNIVTVYDVGVHEGNHYLSMEYVPGEDLKAHRYQLSLSRSLEVVKDVAKALDYAGRKGYIHRDVKPENIMIHGEDQRAVLMDFGIARASDVASGMTQTGTTMGTPHYMSPEQAKGAKVDPRSDLYSLGVVLFQLICGYVPFDADSAVAVGIMHVSDPIPELPEHLAIFQPIVSRALAKKPDQRYQNGAEFIADLNKISAADIEAMEEKLAQIPKVDEANESAATVVSAPIANTRVDTATSVAVADEGEATEASKNHDAGASEQAFAANKSTDTDAAIGAEEGFSVHGEDSIGDYSEEASDKRSKAPVTIAVLAALGLGIGGWFGWQALPSSSDSHSLGPDTVTATGQEPSAGGGEPSAGSDHSSAGGGEPSASGGKPSAGSDQPSVGSEEHSALNETSLSEQSTATGSDMDATNELPVDSGATANAAETSLADLEARFAEDASVAPELADHYNRMLTSSNQQDIEIAQSGLQHISESLQLRFQQALDDQALEQARGLAETLQQVAPEAERDQSNLEQLAALEQTLWLNTQLTEAEKYLAANSLSSPAGANALESYQAILAELPDNAEAEKGIDRIADRYGSLAEQQLGNQDLQRARTMANRGLALRPEHAQLQDILGQIEAAETVLAERQTQIAALDSSARSQMADGQFIAPKENNAFDTYQQMEREFPGTVEAQAGLQQVELGLVRRIERMMQGNDLEQALLELDSARDRFPQSEGLLTLRLQLDQLAAARQPMVSSLQVSAVPIDDLNQAQADTLMPDRIIYIGFEFANFNGDASVVQAVLMDGSRSVQIAQKPVIVSGKAGIKIFSIERPVAGFGKGAYHVDLSLGDTRLASTSFKVAE